MGKTALEGVPNDAVAVQQVIDGIKAFAKSQQERRALEQMVQQKAQDLSTTDKLGQDVSAVPLKGTNVRL